MENKAQYIVSGVPLSIVAGTTCTLPYSDPGYEPPTPQQVDALIKFMGWSQNDVARLVGVSYDPKKGSTTVRKWRTDKNLPEHRAIPYAAWRLLLIAANIAQHTETSVKTLCSGDAVGASEYDGLHRIKITKEEINLLHKANEMEKEMQCLGFDNEIDLERYDELNNERDKLLFRVGWSIAYAMRDLPPYSSTSTTSN
jgi:hypothetical protein